MDESAACSRAVQEVARFDRLLPYAHLFAPRSTEILGAITNALPTGVILLDLHLITTMEGAEPNGRRPRTQGRIEVDALDAGRATAYVTVLAASPQFSAVRRLPSDRKPAVPDAHAAALLEVDVAPRADDPATQTGDARFNSADFHARLLAMNLALQEAASQPPGPQRQQLIRDLREAVHTARVRSEEMAAKSRTRITSFESSLWADGPEQLRRTVEDIGAKRHARRIAVVASPFDFPGPYRVQTVTMSFDGGFRTAYEVLRQLERMRCVAQFREIHIESPHAPDRTHTSLQMLVLCKPPKGEAAASPQPTTTESR